jgi:predicted metal-binding membrane protein
MILTFARVQMNRQERGEVFVPTWLFVSSYIALWSATGVLAYGIAIAGDEIAQGSSWILENAARLGGLVILIAGIYQLSPLKRICLSKCRTPMSFILSSWREGRAGALRMGLDHAVVCLGCCWLLFVILFPLGMMNIAAMAMITLLIFAEKTLPLGNTVARVAAVAMITYGALVILVPDALPTMTI